MFADYSQETYDRHHVACKPLQILSPLVIFAKIKLIPSLSFVVKLMLPSLSNNSIQSPYNFSYRMKLFCVPTYIQWFCLLSALILFLSHQFEHNVIYKEKWTLNSSHMNLYGKVLGQLEPQFVHKLNLIRVQRFFFTISLWESFSYYFLGGRP